MVISLQQAVLPTLPGEPPFGLANHSTQVGEGLPSERNRATSEADAGNQQVMLLVEQHAVESQVDTLMGDTCKRSPGDWTVMGGLGDAWVVEEAADALLLGILGGGQGEGARQGTEMSGVGLGSAGDNEG